MSHTVNCSVTDCAYNDNNKCTSSNIRIAGDRADTSVETKCDTFTTRTSSFTNMNGGNADNTGIKCKSENCLHNDNCHCTLDSISVNCSCDSCNCSSSEETFCDSFVK